MHILHVFRSPVGGLFRHVLDLARGQTAMGHQVGLLCDSSTGGRFAEDLLRRNAANLTLGVTRVPMSKLPSFGDVTAVRLAKSTATSLKADVIHGHGAKGGLYARLAGRSLGIPSFYTPHGGSLYFKWTSPAGAAFLASEVALSHAGSGFCFVCEFEHRLFEQKIGLAGRPHITALNGLWTEEHVKQPPLPDATDFLFLGEVVHRKGVDVLLKALSRIPKATLTLVGDGPDQQLYENTAKTLGLAQRTRFVGRKPVSEAVRMGRIMVMPSRNESFPYVVLEAAAAGLPLIASAVGGVPEIVPANLLCDPLTADTLTQHMRRALDKPEALKHDAQEFALRVRNQCNAQLMCEKITGFYQSVLSRQAR